MRMKILRPSKYTKEADKLGLNELLISKEYYIAAVDELKIEAELEWHSATSEQDSAENKAMRAALREIDFLKVSGEYEQRRRVLWNELGLEQYHSGSGIEIPARFLAFAKEWDNFKAGLNSPDLEQGKRFQRFNEATQLTSKNRLPAEVHDLIIALERAKKTKGRKQGVRPAWLKDASALDEMRLMHSKGFSVPEAAREVARKEGRAHEDSRAKRFEYLFRQRQKLR